ncbi:PH domain-containing protein [Flavobacterium sp. 14A]|uniref:PH domain-containing protein n=1 Tax=Flavobacterium sp. 14A TaxID=2735896 RepID=UPI00156EBA06|nr:PH domain-containing protein [Flavobacterium sp. 14A]NRT12656.1 hypothetical protein [Flavobacterium sp. 14A]
MDNFTNDVLAIEQLPKYESVVLNTLDSKYTTVVGIAILMTIVSAAAGLATVLYFNPELLLFATQLVIAFTVVAFLFALLSFIGVKKKAYAFREHDVIYQHGIISTTTIVIPYNRVQHVALHEGFVARFFGLARVDIFTAGGSSSDIIIPGIAKEQAEDIKQLLMGKIQKKL